MSIKRLLLLFIIFLTGISVNAQQNYLLFDYSISEYKLSNSSKISATLFEKLNRCEGTYMGASFHFAGGRKNAFTVGMGLQAINYQKEWLGVFPESNQFGAAILDGKIAYWTFPFSYVRIIGQGTKGLNRSYGYRKDRLRFGLRFTYIPAFEAKNSFNVNTFGGADKSIFLSSFQSNEQAFQHSLMLGFCNQFFLLNNHLRMDIEPYAGIGSGYFKESGTNLNNISYGLHFSVGILAKLPHISIEREVNSKDVEEKKKLLEQKQKEIKEQLNKKTQ